MKSALVITTYNNPKYLGICLMSLSNQTRKDFDIFIADDGSSEETKDKVGSFQSLFKNRIRHIWHPDTGYKKSTINNTVFRELESYDTVICMDHDVIAHQRFIEDHLSIHEKNPGTCFMGRRVELGDDITQTINEQNVTYFNRGLSPRLLISGIQGKSHNVMRAWRTSNPTLQRLLGRDRVPDLLGSNFSISREVLYRVNGYNEDFQTYWGEDGDLFVRVRNSGARLLGRKGFAVQYHLDHPRLAPDAKSQARYQELLRDTTYVRCRNGIFKD
jgi:GT2 family glycosyltransferase